MSTLHGFLYVLGGGLVLLAAGQKSSLPAAQAEAPAPPSIAPAAYTFNLTAEESVINSTTAEIANSTLEIGSNAFNTTRPIQATVYVPNDTLTDLTASGPFASLTVEPGLRPGISTPPYISLTINVGRANNGLVNVIDLPADVVVINTDGPGKVVVNGTIQDVALDLRGDGDVSVLGVNQTALIRSTGIGNVYLGALSGDVVISGDAVSLGSLIYNQGTCAVGPDPETYCLQQAVFPGQATPALPQWTCGLSVMGNFTCAAENGISPFAVVTNTSSATDSILANNNAFETRVTVTSTLPPAPAPAPLSLLEAFAQRVASVPPPPAVPAASPDVLNRINATAANPFFASQQAISAAGRKLKLAAGFGAGGGEPFYIQDAGFAEVSPPSPAEVPPLYTATMLQCVGTLQEVLMPLPGVLTVGTYEGRLSKGQEPRSEAELLAKLG
jgi:hypothetical protein